MHEDILATVEAIHAAGFDAALWPRALEAIEQSIGGPMSTLEVFDRRTLQHREFFAHGAPPASEVKYLDHYAALNVRVPSQITAKTDNISYDYAILDEAAMSRTPFYAEFLASMDLRYFVAGIIASSEREFAMLSVQRSAKQGHVGKDEIALMRLLLPHASQAFDMGRRLKAATAYSHALEQALDRLADGVALLEANGAVLFANENFHAIARRDDGLRLRNGMIELTSAEACERLYSALAATARLADGDARALPAPDFTVPRRSGGEPFLVSVRPLLDRSRSLQAAKAVAIVFVRDPLARAAGAIGMLRELFGLTEAEASLAQALQSGTNLSDYAHSRGLSLNTVYTHLRRLREKTRSNRLPDLIHKLNELRLPLRVD
jgi:DNA-binding CsgD family transcriptional regulator